MASIRDRLWDKAGEKRIPLTAAFELLPVCNLSCKMCYVRKSMKEVNKAGGLLSGKQWLEYAKEARDLGLLFPLVTGGEPFLHPDFCEIFEGMLKMGMQVSINSNGTMIDEKMAKWLGQHKPTRINITLYGSSRETYQRLCDNADAFDRVRNAVRLLKENNVPVKFNASITPQNVNDLESMIAYAKEVEIPIQVATYMFPPIRRDQTMIGKNNRLSPEDAAKARVRADFAQGDPKWFLGQAMRFKHFIDPEKAILNDERIPDQMKMSCRAGICSFWIDWQGNMLNCGMYGSAKILLKGTSIKYAWEKLVKDTSEVRYSPACTKCLNRQLCHPCIAMVSNECGDVNGRPEYLCKMNAASAKYYQEYASKLNIDVNEDNISLEGIDTTCDIDQL